MFIFVYYDGCSRGLVYLFFSLPSGLEKRVVKECKSERMGRETKTAACVCLAMGCVANLVASALAFTDGVCICSPIDEHELLFFD